ncbi:piggyBac transposable element-derived protein 2-like [Hydra vulgaris]|uniref:piggyBac transposable element-derived protein 2-like n=1 Tax=Hydra vulgaris TaxID=6087 RepID=UPI001F5F495A|nr:piggyBac transposable element-derived protein 2-like [Hydra vulgaris]
MKPVQFYKKTATTARFVRNIPAESDDDELSSSDNEVAEVSSGDDTEEYEVSDQQDSSDNEQPSTSAAVGRSTVWKCVTGQSSAKSMPESADQRASADTIKSPVEYFRYFFDSGLVEHITDHTNLYATQKDVNKPIGCSKDEIEQFLGMTMYMSIFNLPRSKMYWGKASRLSQVADVMSRDRWVELKSNLHFNDNGNMLAPDDVQRDKLFKIRPLIDSLLPKFHSLEVDHKLSVDEQIIPFKGQSGMKQYIPSKPYKWGYKVFMLCDVTGIVHNFIIYTGKIQAASNQAKIGASGNIVLQLVEVLPQEKQYLLFFDNWFTSLKLLSALANRNILAVGTVRANRLQNCKMIADATLKKKGRGSFEEREGVVNGVEVRVVKWFDNKSVTLASTFASAEPVSTARRWDRTTKQHIDVPRPEIIQIYNKFMGGVDTLDAIMARYRIHLKSKKYYHRFFFHFVDLAVATGWLLYRRDCRDMGVDKRQQKDLMAFKLEIADALCREGKDMTAKKRGRPSTSMEAELQRKKKRGPAKPVPTQDVRTDSVGHWPAHGVRQRCKRPGCKGQTVFVCTKCNANLCLSKKSNCFRQFHE